MAPVILKPKNIVLNNLVFSDVKENQMGGNGVYISYDNPKMSQTHRIYVQTPKMFVPFGASKYSPKDKKQREDETPRYSLNLSFGRENNSKITNFKEKMISLDKYVAEQLLKNNSWIKALGMTGKKLTMDSIDLIRSSIIRYANDPSKDYPPTINVKVPNRYDTNEFVTEFYDKNKVRLEVDRDNIESIVPPKSEVKCLLQISNIWFIGGKFGVSVKALQVAVYPSESITGYAFDDSSDEEREDVKAVNEVSGLGLSSSDSEQEEEEVVVKEQTVLSDSEEEEEEVVEVKKPPPKKRRGRRKKTGGV